MIDECHRSIYNVWRQVIEYFDAFLIGLTATPSPQTIGFFRNNVVQDYSHAKAVADGINVGYDIYRIKTRITEEGGAVLAQAGTYVPKRDRRTRETTHAELEADLTYTAANSTAAWSRRTRSGSSHAPSGTICSRRSFPAARSSRRRSCSRRPTATPTTS